MSSTITRRQQNIVVWRIDERRWQQRVKVASGGVGARAIGGDEALRQMRAVALKRRRASTHPRRLIRITTPVDKQE
jgi:hypothetical protein